MSIKQEFVSYAKVLRNLHFQEVSGRLGAFFDWMEKQSSIQLIVEDVRRKVDGAALLLAAGQNRPPAAHTPEEIAAVGLTLMEACRREDFAGVCISRGIGPSYQTSQVQAYVDAGLERYVLPFLNHVERELNRAEARHVPARIAERIFDTILLGQAFAEKFPTTHAHLERISSEFARSDAVTAWQNVANSCRQAMIEFCRECTADIKANLPSQAKAGDVKTVSRELVRLLYRGSRSADALADVVTSIWDYAQPLAHRPNATREEAVRVYLWTGLAINEIASLIDRHESASN